MDIKDKVLHWCFTGFTGSSSLTLAAIATGHDSIIHGFRRPYDTSDFFRCYELVKIVPEVKDHFDKVKEVFPEFGPIIDHWDELCDSFDSDKKNGTNTCYDLLHSLNEECHIAGGWQKTRFGWTKEKKAPF